jgi:hypothetical protein
VNKCFDSDPRTPGVEHFEVIDAVLRARVGPVTLPLLSSNRVYAISGQRSRRDDLLNATHAVSQSFRGDHRHDCPAEQVVQRIQVRVNAPRARGSVVWVCIARFGSAL